MRLLTILAEGIVTVVIAAAGYVIIVDFPDSPRARKYFTDEERDVIKLRVQRDRGDAVYDALTARKMLEYACDPVFWTFSFLCGSVTLVV